MVRVEPICFQLSTPEVPIRVDLLDAFRTSWNHIARPGSGWNGRERVAIAGQSRAAWDCAICAERKHALSPNMIQQQYDQIDGLPGYAVEAIHRITTDPGRLTKDWFESLLSKGLSQSQYVEIIGIVGTVTSIDTCCRAIGVDLEPLPEPETGPASGYRPQRLTSGGSWLPMLMDNNLAPAEENLYGGVKPGVNVLRAMSLVPNEVRNLLQICEAMYLNDRDVLNMNATGNRAISREQMELLSSRVSLINDCFY